jgi:hypothetical protein
LYLIGDVFGQTRWVTSTLFQRCAIYSATSRR